MNALLHNLDETRADREELYKWFHRNPELSSAEFNTIERIRTELKNMDIDKLIDVTTTGAVAIIENGEGPVVALRGDIDALPVTEQTGLDYASEVHGVMHACGHDFHITTLLSAVDTFASNRDKWSGTLVAVFQPAEETASGARAMVEADIASVIPKPDVYLGQHVMASQAGVISMPETAVMSTMESIRVRVFGAGTHGSMPHLGVDPIVLAAHIITRLQTVVAREISPFDFGVVTVGAINSGTKANIIPESAEILINTRAMSVEIQEKIRTAIERIVRSECETAGSPKEPTFEYYDRAPLTFNDADARSVVADAFDQAFGEDYQVTPPSTASEDFSVIPDALGVPYVFWFVGGYEDPENAPGNHSPFFAPVIQPTLDRSLEAFITAASAWLVRG
ncbi:amidohydrolase [Corynebacterium gallinarum]|uniref:Amidohydrolase n=1 Tax=Corynebacterium gallinarum TaxID=2762214 RepID=A0A8I0HMP4_9CORY|nr:amidohydrolase [Corynebacterium gallinarum]MBD8030132.1 amidohydrolase [Corynebacterium gallinarum]